MTSAPLATIDVLGNITWTGPVSPPATWVLETCFADGTPSINSNYSAQISGGINSFDAYAAGWTGGFHVKLWAVDSLGDLVLEPTMANGVTANV